MAGLSYPLGWAVWSFNAHKNDLGPMPFVQYQYLVAGLVPLLILVIAIFAGKHLRIFMLETWPKLFDSRATGILALRITIELLFWASFLTLIVSGHEWFKKVFSESAKTIRRIVGFAFMASLAFYPPPVSGVSAVMRIVARWYWLYIFYPGILIAALVFYTEIAYPKLPQEYGGIRPRCVQMDLKKDDLSGGLAKALVSDLEMERASKIVTSKPLDLYFSGSDFHLVKAREIRSTGRNPADRISGTMVNRIAPCPEQE
jgi:hypothetical protein